MTDLYSPFFLPLRSRSRRVASPASPLDGLNSLLGILRPVLVHNSPDPATLEIIREKITLLVIQHYQARFTVEDIERTLFKLLPEFTKEFFPGVTLNSPRSDTHDDPQTDTLPAWL